MNRRRLLWSLGALTAGLCGCQADRDDSPSTSSSGLSTPTTQTPTPSPTPTETEASAPDDQPLRSTGESFETESGTTLSISRPRGRSLVLSPEEVSHHVYYRVATPPEGRQFLVVDADIGGTEYRGRAELPLAVELDGTRYRGEQIRVGKSDSELEGGVGLAVPVTEASDGFVLWERESGPSPQWEIPEETLDALATAPEFSVESVSTPDSVREGNPIPVEFAVANTGERDGRFLTELGVDSGSVGLSEVRVTVPAGDTVTHTERLPGRTTSFEDSVPVAMDWGYERRTWEVDVESTTT